MDNNSFFWQWTFEIWMGNLKVSYSPPRWPSCIASLFVQSTLSLWRRFAKTTIRTNLPSFDGEKTHKWVRNFFYCIRATFAVMLGCAKYQVIWKVAKKTHLQWTLSKKKNEIRRKMPRNLLALGLNHAHTSKFWILNYLHRITFVN